jgi:mono/diheme cytochrome c family protein
MTGARHRGRIDCIDPVRFKLPGRQCGTREGRDMMGSDTDAPGRRFRLRSRVDLVSASRRRISAVTAIAAGCLTLCTSAYAQDLARVAAGENAWDKAGCLQCHGASGEGGTGGEFAAGPSLRTTKLDRAGLVEAISCGLPGTQMPAWLDGAYTQRPCYGFPAGPAPVEVTATPVLSAGEIEALVDFLTAKFVGH